MSSKQYFSIAGVFIALYIIASIGDIWDLPNWIRWSTQVGIAIFALLGVAKKKKEAGQEKK